VPVLNLNLESRILRALCDDSSPSIDNPVVRAIILAKLQMHRWQDPEHRVIFEALAQFPGLPATELREQLPARATRMGFPDVNWDVYFSPVRDDSPVETLVAELLAATREEKP
jgi:hypothetical protein